MAQIKEKPLLSICIPIYNRLSYLERMLERFYEEKELFDSKIELFISDNCSEDDLQSCCNRFSEMGLRLNYHRNDTNLGMDGNFINCFKYANGKYCWVLGSDDIPVHGLLGRLIKFLDEGDYGLVHLSMKQRDSSMQIYDNHDEILANVGYWITYLSGNVIKTDTLANIDLNQYKGTYISQVPAYLNACCACRNNAIIYQDKFFVGDDDSLNNGGYNIFRVFVENLFVIYQGFIKKGLLTQQTLDVIKKNEFKEFISRFVIEILILRSNHHFDARDALKILCKHYGRKLYAYYYVIIGLLKMVERKIVRKLQR